VPKLNVRQITDGLKFPEGPVVMPDGSIVVVEIESGHLVRVALDGRKDAGAAGWRAERRGHRPGRRRLRLQQRRLSFHGPTRPLPQAHRAG